MGDPLRSVMSPDPVEKELLKTQDLERGVGGVRRDSI